MAADPKNMFPTPGLRELMTVAKSANIRMHAVTNAPYENAVFLMDTLRLHDFLEGAVIGERCARPKPFPDPYLEGLVRVGAFSTTCFFFGPKLTRLCLCLCLCLVSFLMSVVVYLPFYVIHLTFCPHLLVIVCVDAQPHTTIVFEDSPTGIRAAVAAGIKVVGVATSQPHDVLYNAGAVHIVKDFTSITLPLLEDLLCK